MSGLEIGSVGSTLSRDFETRKNTKGALEGDTPGWNAFEGAASTQTVLEELRRCGSHEMAWNGIRVSGYPMGCPMV